MFAKVQKLSFDAIFLDKGLFLNNFFSELKRRNVVRVGIAYAVVSWVILQFVDIIQEMVRFPGWFPQMVLVLLIIGLPIALIFSWAYEVTPEGVKKTEEVDKSKSITHGTGQKINKLIIGGLVLAVGFLLYDKFMLNPDQPVITEARAAQTSIAVLPFVNMSSDPEQAFFSDGITEEIINVLAKNRALKVAGRTSSFAYKGKDQDLKAIGKDLGVDYLVEGSIRKAGNTVRITAQVINVADGFHLWSETYDRELTDIFAIQDEIARAVSDALQVSFGLGEGENLVTNRTDNMAAYDLYLKAKDALKRRRIPEALNLSKQVMAMEPDFAPAWAVYAQAEALAPVYIYNFEIVETGGAYGRAEIAAQKALTLDPNSVDALGALANVYRAHLQWSKAEGAYKKALDLDPNSPVILEDYAQFFIAVGKLKEGKPVAEKLAELEPQTPIYLYSLLTYYIANVDNELRLELAKKIYDIDPNLEIFSTAYVYALIYSGKTTKDYFDIYLNNLERGTEGLSPEQMVVVLDDPAILAILDRKNELFAWLTENVKLGYWGDFFTFFPDMRPFWGTPEFKAHMVELELPVYWQENGWPDMCRPLDADDFECE